MARLCMSAVALTVLCSSVAAAQTAATALNVLRQNARAPVSAIAVQSETFPMPWSPSPGSYASSSPDARDSAFAALFAESARTNGRHRLTFAVRAQSIRWRALDGFRLGDNIAPVSGCDDFRTKCPFAALRARRDTMTVGTAYGVTDRIDVAVGVPIVRASVKGTSGKVLNGRRAPVIANTTNAAAEGGGDLQARIKVRVFDRGAHAIAVAGEWRLPTGSRDRLLGAGTFQQKGMVMWSRQGSRLSPHANVGYTWADEGFTTSTLTAPR